MCGILGIASGSVVSQEIVDGLTILQHRGQDAAGIATFDGKNFHMRKGNGLVRDVFFLRHVQRLFGNMGIGHVRYPTAGCNSSWEAQPFFVNSPFGIVLAHNGNLTNADKLSKELCEENLRHLNTTSDSEILLNVLANKLLKLKKTKLQPDDIFKAVTNMFKRINGSFAAIAIIAGQGMVAFRDPLGIKPLVIGERKTTSGVDYFISSESTTFSPLGFKLIRDIAPGEAILIKDGKLYSKICAEKTSLNPCIFEYIYLARPDSMMDEISVHKSRMRMGNKLAEKIQKRLKKKEIDVVIPIPETARVVAAEVAEHLSIPYREGFIKNRYIGRTFIMPGQKMRKKSVHYKLSAIDLEFKDKNVLLVDDSIVRGNTSKEIVRMARDAGARKVYFASAAPPLLWPCVYGVDMPSKKDFVANGLTEREVANVIGADELFYQDLNDLISAVKEKSPKIKNFCTACFNGKYPTKDVDEKMLREIEIARAKNASLIDAEDKIEENPVTLL